MKRSTIISVSLSAGAMLSLGPAVGVAAAAPQSGSSAPSSQSSSPARLSLNRVSGAPGSTTTARLSGCLTGQRSITAPAVFHKTHTGGAAGSLLADYTVAKNAKPGNYTIYATCAGKDLTATYTVIAAGDTTGGGHHGGSTTSPTHNGSNGGSTTNGGTGQINKVPTGSVNTGGGATAGVEQPWLLAIGGTAILAGAGTAAAAVTRLRKQ